MQDDKVQRMKEIGENLVEAAQEIIEANASCHAYPIAELGDKDYWKGADGACPHCHGNAFYIYPGTNHVVCELCGLEGRLNIVDGAFKFENDPSLGINGHPEHAHDLVSGKKMHGDDIFENEGRLMNLFKDPEFKARKQKYTDVVAPTLPERD